MAVVGVPDELWGEQVAVVRPASGRSPSQEELFAYCGHVHEGDATFHRWPSGSLKYPE